MAAVLIALMVVVMAILGESWLRRHPRRDPHEPPAAAARPDR
jgi:hypothetical protein